MPLQSTDLFLVSQGTDLKKCTLDQIENYISKEIAAGDTVSFKGNVDLTQPYNAGAQLVTNPPLNADAYINTGTGTIGTGWVIEGGATECIAGQRILWDEGDSNWILIGGDAIGGVESVSGTNGLELDASSTAENVVLKGVDAAVGTVGVVTLSDPDGTSADGDYQPATDNVLTEHHYNQLEEQIETAVSGGITTITGDPPITVTGTGNSRQIGVNDADNANKGVVVLTDTPTYNDTRASADAVAVTPAGLVANWVPKNWTDIPALT